MPGMAYRYLGNKTRILPWLMDVMTGALPRGCAVADPMCGTATVSEALAAAGFAVTAADELTFPVLHAKARLLLRAEPPFAGTGGYREALRRLNALPGAGGFFRREYSADGSPANGCAPRAYFTGANAARIDAMRAAIAGWGREGVVTPDEHALLLHDLVLAANDVANIAGTYGYYRSTWNSRALDPIELRPSAFRDVGGGHRVRQGRVEQLAEGLDVDACYLDPPYTKRQYAGNYHLLETLAREDEPEPVGEGGLRDWYGQYSSFCSKRFVAGAFAEVVKRLDVEHLFVSYSDDGLLPAGDLHEILAGRGTVRRFAYPLTRYRSNGGGRSGDVSEYLFHVRMS